MRQQPESIATLLDQGRYQEALARATAASEPCPPGPEQADALEQLGVARRELGQYAPAEAALLQALAVRSAVQGKEHPARARTMTELGRLYEELGRTASATGLYQGALAVIRATLGADA